MFGISLPRSASSETETVEEYRRYPPPEILELALRSGHPTPSPAETPSASTLPVEPVAPRNRSPATPSRSSAHSSTSFAEAVTPNEHGGADPSSGYGEEECNENKTGNYKAVPATMPAEKETIQPSSSSEAATAETHGEAKGAPQAQQAQEGPQGHHPTETKGSTRIAVRLRWGFEAADLRRVYEMHEDAFPLSYGPAYYEWLLNHDACMGLVATVTAKTYTQFADATTAVEGKGFNVDLMTSEEDSIPLQWFPGYTPSPAGAAAGPRPLPPSASQRPLTAEVISERAQVDAMLTDLEYIAKRKEHAQTKNAPVGTAEPHATDADADAYTEVIGFILGQCAYARHDAGHLFTNPTTYIGSFVVDPRFQRCGLGSALLQRFLVYVTQQRPLYAQDYLHYDERKLIAMLVQAQLKKRNTHSVAVAQEKDSEGARPSTTTTIAAASAAAADKPAKPARFPSLLHQIASAYLPEAVTWWEDRQARRRLRAQGLTEDQIDAQRFRDGLAPDVLTDEEAEEVRREARHFVVQTGMHEVWLHCLPGNMKATQLYARRGFQLHRLLKDYYDIGTEKYDANLLVYSCGVAGAVVPVAAGGGDKDVREHHGSLSSTTPFSEAGAAGVDDMDAVAQSHHTQGQTQPRSTAAVAASTAAAGFPSPTGVTGEGLRRRHQSRQTDSAAKEGVEKAGVTTPLPATEPAAGTALVTTSGSTSASPTPPPTAAASSSSPTTTTAVPATEPHDTRRALASTSWLSQRTYPVVADIILCTAAEGQEEWQRRFGGSGDVTGRRSWCGTVVEVALLINAVGLFCAVLWLAYNVGLTGRVE
jgi:ribosomal protein S18 acetylase RimI-like enzyme